ncbi:MAG TPA: hypothetical protein VLS90_19950 [Thermodesulfobacteriota bacterium]|nr:hypothetical protein [Thermodesulfobacteriota bacterium]
MAAHRGIIAIMGSGETTDSMVRVHRALLERIEGPGKAVFLDTPAGFQLNADDLFEKAREYFQRRIDRPLERASFKSRDIPAHEAERAYQSLREANYIFVGPGSPTYALKNWIGTPIPQIIAERVKEGACFVAASAAALTLGRFTIPVYEIYKAGEDVHWACGLNLLEEFGLSLVVIPHWNNAEGGTHDTRFCYMGEPRLVRLESLLPQDTPILGVDEHTACILNFSERRGIVRGAGGITLRHAGKQAIFRDGQSFTFDECREFLHVFPADEHPSPIRTLEPATEPLPERVKSLNIEFGKALEDGKADPLIEIVLNMEQAAWNSRRDLAEEDQISEAREVLRSILVRLALRIEEAPADVHSVVSPLVKTLLEIRARLRDARNWEMADFIRDRLGEQGILVEDTAEGPRWHMAGEHREEK